MCKRELYARKPDSLHVSDHVFGHIIYYNKFNLLTNSSRRNKHKIEELFSESHNLNRVIIFYFK